MTDERPWAPISGAELRAGLLRDEVRRLLPMLTPDQLGLFGRIFPGGVDGLSEDSAASAIQLIRRTLDARDRRVRHGETCEKAAHSGTGYLHDENDDTPYDVDGLLYCGRCHRSIDAPEGKATP